MAKIGENVPLLIDKAVDFMASSQAFKEYLNKMPERDDVPSEVPAENAQMYLQRLKYYRRLYQPVQEKE
ncbi:TPA: hypothetical protein N2R15_001487 [Citrobacter amalonaticus]|uniref:Cytoplasmic protein n=1 Tax=Citrobacter telavivensis TaxID=2653932 RepID=A0A6L5EAI8_9ENTR|nr:MULTISPECIES: hypothetical protein [Citrobacter]EKZ2525828.1 hypothetical protein [Citrobacter farmeri]HCL6626787.1 hypothetical protein [Citrobacter amalonaticus]MDM2735331.1 hypothetical protein [Citrobacter sp. Ct235]MPQ52141.1 hypothetical protein [Citrobacter telavivensis]QFS69365.1 hypothetical protein GBC03_03640 [Citrobacter telavivensis]